MYLMYYKYTRACTKGVSNRASMYYKRHIVLKQEVDIHEAGDKAIDKKNVKYRFMSALNPHP